MRGRKNGKVSDTQVEDMKSSRNKGEGRYLIVSGKIRKLKERKVMKLFSRVRGRNFKLKFYWVECGKMDRENEPRSEAKKQK